ncbi:MAG: ABC transporter permease [Actinobacteria bacterium]|nr:ABC transporter permease [Actinomycetota bacterium]
MTSTATDALVTPEPGATSGPTTAFLRLPRAVRFMVYASAGVAVLAITREITGADQLTSEGTFSSAIQLTMPIALAGLGGLWSERAGVVNIGLEGMMVLGTWFGAYGGIQYGPWQGVALGVLGGLLGGVLHALATVVFGVDQIISGVAINILAVGLTEFLTSVNWDGASARESPSIIAKIPRVDLLPFLEDPLNNLASQGRFFLSDMAELLLALTTDVSLLVVIAVALFPLSWFVLWRTPFGLRLRSTGEDPDAADSLGIAVYRTKFVAVSLSGAFAGLGGVTLVYLFSSKFQTGQTTGRGFIGLAAMIFGNWRPGGTLLGAGLFGFMDSMQAQVDETAHALLVAAAIVFGCGAVYSATKRNWTAVGVLVASAALSWYWYATTDELPREFIPYFPHVTTLLVLVFASQRLRMPAADGKVWRRGSG